MRTSQLDKWKCGLTNENGFNRIAVDSLVLNDLPWPWKVDIACKHKKCVVDIVGCSDDGVVAIIAFVKYNLNL